MVTSPLERIRSMKTRVFVPLIFAAFMLISGKAAIGEIQQRIGESVIDINYPYGVKPHWPATQQTSSAVTVQTDSAETTVLISSQGLNPSQVTIQVGQVITWVNQTSTVQRLVSGQPYQVYLPLVLRNAGSSDSGIRAVTTGRETTSTAEWGGDIAPGGIYTHTFTVEGNYSYFVATHPDWTGQVVVTDTGRDLDEIVRFIRILSSESNYTVDCGASYDYYQYIYYTSEAWLEHGFGGSWQTRHSFYPPGLRLSRYYVLAEDAEPVTSPHSFAHDLSQITYSPNNKVVSYTGTFTSTLYASFTYSITIPSYPYLESATVHKDYGEGETYRIELEITRDLSKPKVLSYMATVYGGSYQGITRTITNVESSSLPVLCIRY